MIIDQFAAAAKITKVMELWKYRNMKTLNYGHQTLK